MVRDLLDVVRGDSELEFIVDQDTRCTVACAEAFGEFQRDLAIGCCFAWRNSPTLAQFGEQLFATAQHAWQR